MYACDPNPESTKSNEQSTSTMQSEANSWASDKRRINKEGVRIFRPHLKRVNGKDGTPIKYSVIGMSEIY